jgi:hypothetical protein
MRLLLVVEDEIKMAGLLVGRVVSEDGPRRRRGPRTRAEPTPRLGWDKRSCTNAGRPRPDACPGIDGVSVCTRLALCRTESGARAHGCLARRRRSRIAPPWPRTARRRRLSHRSRFSVRGAERSACRARAQTVFHRMRPGLSSKVGDLRLVIRPNAAGLGARVCRDPVLSTKEFALPRHAVCCAARGSYSPAGCSCFEQRRGDFASREPLVTSWMSTSGTLRGGRVDRPFGVGRKSRSRTVRSGAAIPAADGTG